MERRWTLQEAVLYGHGVERTFLCPVHGDSRPSASLNIVKQKWYCYTCGARGGLTGEDALLEPDYQILQEWIDDLLEEAKVYPEAWLDRFTVGVEDPYWTDRLGPRAAERFRLGYDPETDSATYPLRDATGQVLGVVRRPLRRDGGPKYLYPRKIDVGQLLFGYTGEQRSSVVLVEGAVDAMSLWNDGVHGAMAIYGSSFGAEQARLISRVDPDVVWVMTDMDTAGEKAYRQIRENLKGHIIRRVTWDASMGKDPDELTGEYRKEILAPLVCNELMCVECASWKPPPRNSSSGSARPRRLRIERTRTS